MKNSCLKKSIFITAIISLAAIAVAAETKMKVIGKKELDSFQEKADRMKQKVLTTPNMDPAKFTGTVYYVSADGDDANDGKSPERALKSIEGVKKLKLASGDAVLFRRGDLFRGHSLTVPDGVTLSAWGEGAKPTLCSSMQNYADPALWKKSDHPGIWACTIPFRNVGLITFDHDPQVLGKYDVMYGNLVCPAMDLGGKTYVFPDTPPLQLKNDLEFWTDNEKQTLYLRSDRNPAERFRQIEIAPEYHTLIFGDKKDVTIDNLHITLAGRHGISGKGMVNFTVRNCVLDYIGGSVLWESHGDRKNVRFGNAVEVYRACNGYRVYNNWIYQIYDTGVTHQCNDRIDLDVVMKDVEYFDNLIEYCYWSIEYYNRNNRSSLTKDIHVHDNFCRFGGEGWGCGFRKHTTPMYSIDFCADKTENYLTENNIFQFSEGKIISISGKKTDSSGFRFRHNTYIQYENGSFANDTSYTSPETENFLKQKFGEEDAVLLVVPQAIR